MTFARISLLFLLIILSFMLQHDCHSTNPSRVLLISFDGFRWDYLQKTKNAINFQKIINNGGLSTYGLKNAFITKTLPNHYTLVTGLYEESHGMVANYFFDPAMNRSFHLGNKTDMSDWRWFDEGAEPIWVTNQKQSREHRSGSVFWPGTAASVDGIYPTKYLEFDSSYPFKSRVDKIVQWFNDDYPINLGLLYFEEPDATGHQFGPESEEMVQKIEELDQLLGYLLEQLENSGWLSAINIIILSDHGMAATPEDYEVNLDSYISPESYVIYTDSPIADIHPKSKELTEEVFRNLSNVPHITVYKKEDIPQQYHYTHNRRIGPILVVADEHYWLSHNNSHGLSGNHGYNNSLPSMHPVFMAMGPAFKKNASVDIFNNVDIYLLLCHILKLKPAPNNGTLEVVQHLLLEPLNKTDTRTFGVYMMIIVFAGLVSGIFGVVACHAHKTNTNNYYKTRSYRSLTATDELHSKLDSVPLMDEFSDDEANTADVPENTHINIRGSSLD